MRKFMGLLICAAVMVSMFAGQCYAASEKSIKLDEDWRLTSEFDINAGEGNIITIDGQGKYTIYEMAPAAILKNTSGTVKLKNVKVIRIAGAPVPGSLAALSLAAADITSMAAPAKDATSLVFPAVEGCTVSIESSSNPGVIAVNGTITPPEVLTTVNLVLKLSFAGNTNGEACTGIIPVAVPAKSSSSTPEPSPSSTPAPSPSSTPGTGSGNTGDSDLTPVTPSVTVTDNNAGNASGIHVLAVLSAAAGASGNAIATVSQTVADDIIKAAKDAAAIGKSTTAEFKIESDGVTSAVSVNIPKEAFASMAASTINAVKITADIAEITFDKAALAAIKGGAGDVSISVAKLDTGKLTSEVKAAVGSRPVYEFSVTCGAVRIADFNGGSAAVSIPYVLKQGEDPSAIVIDYIDADGKLQTIKASSYDAAAGRVTFTTTHFSRYAVGYRNLNFTDLSNHWAKGYINYLAARNIIAGMDGNKFAPDANVTRAQLVKLVIGAVDGIDVTKAKAASFTDISQGQWYSPYINWAAENAVITGIGSGKFGTGSSITRQDMAAIIYRFTQKMGIQLAVVNDRVVFEDDDKIASYAKNAVYALQSADILSGSGGNMFSPEATATRAEAAKIIAGIVNDMAR